VTALRGDVFRFVKSCKQQFDFIFADPPYALKELPTIPDLIFEKGLLKPEGIFVFEHGKNHDFSAHPHFVEHRSYGSVNFSLFR
jgi:16S rRNA G966 N2-methylase RsmD